MTHGLNLEQFNLQRIQTPDWAVQTQTGAAALSEDLREHLAVQQESILKQVEATLRWALTDPDAIRQFQHMHPYADKVYGNYFVGSSPEGF